MTIVREERWNAAPARRDNFDRDIKRGLVRQGVRGQVLLHLHVLVLQHDRLGRRAHGHGYQGEWPRGRGQNRLRILNSPGADFVNDRGLDVQRDEDLALGLAGIQPRHREKGVRPAREGEPGQDGHRP